jgi:Sulfotransferase family
MRVMFDAHPQMAVPTEVYFPIPAPASWFDPGGALDVAAGVAALESRPWYPKMRLEPGAFRDAAMSEAPSTYPDLIRCLYATYAQAQGKPRYGNKSPMHVARIPQLLAMFPEARFIHIVRDGRNVTLSYMENNFGPSDFVGAAKAWRTRVLRGRRAGTALGEDRYREVRYEDMLDDPEGVLRSLCTFVDLPYDDSMLRYYERIPTMVIGESKHEKLSQPPTKGMRDWRQQMAPRQVALFESLAGDALDAFGYARANVVSSLADRIRNRLTKARFDVPMRVRRAIRKPMRRLRHGSAPVPAGADHG